MATVVNLEQLSEEDADKLLKENEDNIYSLSFYLDNIYLFLQ